MKRRKSDILINTLIVFFLFLFVFSAVMLIKELRQGKQEESAFEEIRSMLMQAEQSAQAAAAKEDGGGHWEEKIPLNYALLYEKNSDFAGWLTVPGTKIDYPVMLTPGEPEYYLHRAFDKSSSKSGTPFVGENCETDSDCLIIYGHNMKNGTMFGSLDKYVKKAFWEQNKTITFCMLNEQWEYEIFAALETRILSEEEEGMRYYNYSGELSDAQRTELTDWLIEQSIYDTGIIPADGEQILILSTCSYHTDDGRFLVAARKGNYR